MFLIRIAVVLFVVMLFLPGGPRTIGPDGAPVPDDAVFCLRYPKTCAASGEILEAMKQKSTFAISWLRQRIGSQAAALNPPGDALGREPGTQAYSGDEPPDGERRWAQTGARGWSGSAGVSRDTLRPEDRAPDWRGRP
jgi:hypothetical protein